MLPLPGFPARALEENWPMVGCSQSWAWKSSTRTSGQTIYSSSAQCLNRRAGREIRHHAVLDQDGT
ncbi:hypothetical protein E2320_007285 [Naja naja]|nr:hypothetical protein E2320_007285 [Naja naja]